MRVPGALLLIALLSGATALESPVADAAMRGDIESVRSLIKKGLDVNAAQGDGMTALHWAAQRGDSALAAVLIRASARVDVVTRIGSYTPLHVASQSGNAAVVAALLKAGSNPKALTTTGVTPLHLAAMSGSAVAVGSLIDRGADVNAKEPAWGQTPLMLAAAHNRVAAVRALVKRGADVAIAAKVVDLNTLATEDRMARQARNQLLDEFRKAAGSPQVWNPAPGQVQAAVQASLAAEKLAASGVKVAEPTAPAAAGGGGGGDEDVAGYTGMVGFQGGLTALLLAVREGHGETVQALLEGGADINQPVAADNTTPLLLASINGHYDLARTLLERGANPKLASDAGATPLYAVLNKEWAPSSRTPQPTYNLQQKTTYLELVEVLLKAGADPNARLKRSLWYTTYNRDNLRVDFTGATAFWRAAYATDIAAMQLLLAHGADPNLPTLKKPRAGTEEEPAAGVPAIVAAAGVGYGRGYASNDHRHVTDGWLPSVKYLVEQLGADVNAKDADGFTPLHYAAARGDNEMIRYLVSKGADVTVVARSGQTTADMANGPVQRISPFLETVKLLETLGSKNNHKCVGC